MPKQHNMSTFSFLVISLLEFLIFAFGTFGNFITCYVVFRNKQLQSSAFLFVVSLAFADLLTCVLLVPTRSLQHLGVFIHNPSLTHLGLSFVPVVGRVTLLASFTNLAVLSIDRLIAVSLPFYYRLNLRDSKKSVAFVILGIWILSVLLTSLPELKAIDQKLGLILFASCLIAATFIILLSNARVLFIVRKQSRFRRQLLPTNTVVCEQKIKPLKNSYFKSADEDERELENYQENRTNPAVVFHSGITKQAIQEHLNIVKQVNKVDCHHLEHAVLDPTRRYSLNLHETGKNQRKQLKNNKFHQTLERSPTNVRNTGYSEQENGSSTLNIQRASWPDASSRITYENAKMISDSGIELQSIVDFSSTSLEIHEIEKAVPKGRPSADFTTRKTAAFIDVKTRRTGNSGEKKKAISVVIVIFFFIVLVYPRLSLIFYHLFYAETFETTVARLWLRVLMYANSAVNPVLYAWRMTKFKNAFRNIITCKKY